MISRRHSIVFACIAIVFLFTSGYVGTTDLGNAFAQAAKVKKKLYISTIKANGVSKVLTGRVKEGIRLAIFESYGANYSILDDDAIRVMYKQAADIMASGCDDTSCITQIADGINADDIVYGEISPEGTKIGISITCLERKGMSLETKSIVKLSILESQLDYAASETAKKIMDPKYKIDMSRAPDISGQVKLGGIEIKTVQGLDISIIKFKSEDETASKIIDYSKGLVAQGDEYFNNQKYAKARSKYLEIIEKAHTKLSAEKRARVKEYLDGISKRIDSTYIMEFKPGVEKVDGWLKGIKDPEQGDLERGLKKYASIEEDINEDKSPYYDVSNNQILSAINDRKDAIQIAILSVWEVKGDNYYQDYKFAEAIDWFKKALVKVGVIINDTKKSEAVDRINKKVDATLKTGQGYLANRVKSFVDQAEFYNFQDKTSNARNLMREAKNLITEKMKVFVTMPAVKTFNDYADILKIDPLTSGELPELFAVAAMEAAQEKFKMTGVYTIGMKGPAGGIIFYDKGNNSDGWRYLEAAPEDQSTGAPWGCINISLGNDYWAIGTGKKNTIATIVNVCAELGTAAKICVEYRGGGKSDWFLPSKDELDLMYKNLHKHGIGGFANDYYWSSSGGAHGSGDSFSWYQNFSSGSQDWYRMTQGSFSNRYFNYRVRAIRAF